MDELKLSDLLEILKRRKNIFLLTFVVLWLASVGFALSWNNYQSVATVEIDQPEIAPDTTTLAGTGNSNPADTLADLQIDKIEQKVTAPASLIEIINKFNLYPDAREYSSLSDLAARMAGKIKLTLLSSDIANPAAQSKVSADQLSAIAFMLSFDYKNPQVAQQVANELITRFLDEDLKERRAMAKATSDFLGAQITALDASMADQEKKIADFQEKHGESKPEDIMFRQQSASTIQMNIQNLDAQMTANQGTQGGLRAQLASVDPYSRVIADGQVLTTPRIQLKALEAQYSTLSAQYGPNYPDVLKAKHQIDALKEQVGHEDHGKALDNDEVGQLKAKIIDVTTNLKAAQKTYGPENPDVISLQNQLKNLKAQLADAKASSANDRLKNDADNPAYLELSAQLRSVQEQYKSLEAQKESLTAQLEKTQQIISETPAIEQQMAVLSRDYDNSQLRYRALKEKKMAADMEQQMQEDKEGQRLVVISPPDLPHKTHPSRILLIVGGFVLAMMAGFGVVFLAHLMSNSIFGAQSLRAVIGVPPMVSVPYILTETEYRRHRRFVPYVLIGGVLFTAVALVVFNMAVMPLDVLWSIILQKIML